MTVSVTGDWQPPKKKKTIFNDERDEVTLRY